MSLIMIALAAAAVATPDQRVATPAPQASPATEDKLVCRRGVNSTGSRIRVRPLCMTRGDWRKREEDDRKLMGRVQASSQVGNKTPDSNN